MKRRKNGKNNNENEEEKSEITEAEEKPIEGRLISISLFFNKAKNKR